MNTQSPNGLYFLNSNLNSLHLSRAISMYLKKAYALAAIAINIDADIVGNNIMESYLWTLSDLLQEVNWLHEQFISHSN